MPSQRGWYLPAPMASRLSLPEADLSCTICQDIFTDPVVLKCSHSFCSPCLKQHWALQTELRSCPLCRSPSWDDPVPSLTIKNLCESFIQEDGVDEDGDGDGELSCGPKEMCLLHREELKLFCLVDQEPICVVCSKSKRHKQHDCCPVSEAIEDVKARLKAELCSLKQRKDTLEKTKGSFEDAKAHIQVQAQYVRKCTRDEFDRLRRFLRAEEDARMVMLQKEVEEKARAMTQKINKANTSLESACVSIKALEDRLAMTGIAVFQKENRSMPATACDVSLVDKQAPPVTGGLIDEAKYLGSLSFHVWEKMRHIVKYTPVVLDPNTAAPWLVLSHDLTSVSDSDKRQMLPDTPERFDPDTVVLGRQGFTSGKHVWDVNVGANIAWVVGVAKESVKRKQKEAPVLKNGYLTLYFYQQMYIAGTSPLTKLSLKKNLRKIRVQLDYDNGCVSFFDGHNKAHIYTFHFVPTERLYPYFWVGCQRCPIKLEPVEVLVKVIVDTF
ncbi:zinc-binding protein A33-like [Nerophis ophidion]|uniref:zinc-binding protein A33-like n=1 Tax=Nerophis ophidion TaxID=159077 RepID=UPI002AE03D5A|nr:zinc-binding protein A33-like [Nerophis ophidion]